MSEASNEKAELLNLLFREIFHAVTESEVFRFEKGKFYMGDVEVGSAEVLMLQQQAQSILSSRIWELLQGNMRSLAIQRMASQSKNWEDVFFGKAMLYELNVIQNSLRSIAILKVVEENKPDGTLGKKEGTT